MKVTKPAFVMGLSIIAVLMLAGIGAAKMLQQSPGTAPPPADMALIPAGEFTMGHDEPADHGPAHRVKVQAFYLDKLEVSNSEYLKFCEAAKHPLPEFWGTKEFHSGPDFADHPVVGISWQDAKDYADWAGKRLPTEAEWEYAARGGLQGKNFPLGDELSPSQANFAIPGKKGGTAPVGSYAPNGYGLHDMSGNVTEWVADYYHPDYYQSSPVDNPMGPTKGRFRVIRGGGWHSGMSCNRVYYRNALHSNWVDFNVGFRCAKSIDTKP